MILLLYIFIGIIAFIYWYSLGVYFVAKRLGYKSPKKSFIPFYSFKIVSELVGVFTIFTIPVKKYLGTVVIFVLVILGACAYALWGNTNLPVQSSGPLWQIMGVVIGICAFSFYFCIYSSTTKLFLKFKLERTSILTIFTLLLLPVTFVYIYLSKRELRILE